MQLEIEAIDKASKILIEQQKIKIQQSIEEIGDTQDTVAEMRKNALYATLDKMDIHEEIVRFKSHLKNFADHLHSTSVEKGKQFDLYVARACA